jgi:hypothetical protein
MPASSQTRSDLGLRIRVAPEEVSYWHWPLRDGGWGVWFTAALVLLAPPLVVWLTESLPMGGFTLACLLAASWRTWLPIRVTIGPSGVDQTILGRRNRIPWLSIRHYEVGRHGVLLLPDAVVNQFSALRGIYLYWGRHRAAVLANFEYYLPIWAADGEAGNESTNLASPPAGIRGPN